MHTWEGRSRSGAVIREPTAQAFCGELEALLRHPAVLKRMGSKARAWALRQFDETRLLVRYEELYGQAAARAATLRLARQQPPDLRASA